MTPRIIRFDRAAAGGEADRPERVLAGDPLTRSRNLHTGAGGGFFAGVWESTVGKWRIRYEEEEFCVILSGRIILADEAGVAESFGPGDAFVIPSGFVGTWETVEPVRKWYAIAMPSKERR